MNSPPTPPYCGSVAAALHLMNSQIRCGSCREKAYGVFYKLRDKKRSKESAYVLVAFRFLARPFVSFVRHIARYAPSSTDKSSSLRNQKSTQPKRSLFLQVNYNQSYQRRQSVKPLININDRYYL